MFSFSKQIDYGLQLIIALSELKDGEWMSLKKFAKQSNISFLFLQRIARRLGQAKIITAVKGSRGGYHLLIPSEKLKLRRVFEALEGECQVAVCVPDNYVCPRNPHCPAQPIFRKINQHFLAYLDKLCLKDCLKYDNFAGQTKK